MKPAQIPDANNSEPDYALMQDIAESEKFKMERHLWIWLYLLQLDFCLILVKSMTRSVKFGKINLKVIADNWD